MIRDFIVFVLNIFVLEPFQVEISQRLDRLGAPPAVIRDVMNCASAAQPVLVQRFSDDPMWAAGTVLRLWLGTRTYQDVLRAEVPACAPALGAAQPYLEGAGAQRF
jgi:hypothetical protein